MLNAPTVIRTGNLVSELLTCKTHNLPSINAAKRFIHRKLKPPLKNGRHTTFQSIVFPSRAERRKALWNMHKQLNGTGQS